MKKIICKKEYDTDTARVIKRRTVGDYGDEEGYEEILYQTPDGSYFIYTNGGASSKYKKEDIKRLSKAAMESWISEN